MKLNLTAIIILIILSSCDKNRIYETNYDLVDKNWPVNKRYVYEFNVDDTLVNYNIYYNIRNTVSYPYYNLYVRFFITDSTNKVLKKGLSNMNLFDPVTGKPYGNGLGDVYEHQILAFKGYQFKNSGKYKIKLEQFMRTRNLTDILTVGVKIEKASQK